MENEEKKKSTHLVEEFDPSKVIIFPDGTKFYDYYRLYDDYFRADDE